MKRILESLAYGVFMLLTILLFVGFIYGSGELLYWITGDLLYSALGVVALLIIVMGAISHYFKFGNTY